MGAAFELAFVPGLDFYGSRGRYGNLLNNLLNLALAVIGIFLG
jgi:hypothetical protein